MFFFLFNRSPAYRAADKSHENSKDKSPPLAQPEPISDSSNGIINKTTDLSTRTAPLQSINLSGDSVTNSPLALSPPIDITSILNLPENLSLFYGRPNMNRRIEKDKKIVFYILAPDDGFQVEKSILHKLLKYLRDKYESKGFEMHLTDLHIPENYSKSNAFDLVNWLEGPLEAQCGHHLGANCLAEISREKIFLRDIMNSFKFKNLPFRTFI